MSAMDRSAQHPGRSTRRGLPCSRASVRVGVRPRLRAPLSSSWSHWGRCSPPLLWPALLINIAGIIVVGITRPHPVDEAAFWPSPQHVRPEPPGCADAASRVGALSLHCRTILTPSFRDVGTGELSAAVSRGSAATWTQDFGLLMSQSPPSANWGPADGCPY